MATVVFNEDPENPIYDSYLEKQKQIFNKPSSSDVISFLVDNHVIKSERQGGITVAIILFIMMVTVCYLFYRHVIHVPRIDTHTDFRPTIIEDTSF